MSDDKKLDQAQSKVVELIEDELDGVVGGKGESSFLKGDDFDRQFSKNYIDKSGEGVVFTKSGEGFIKDPWGKDVTGSIKGK